ncbi:MAG: dTMP kinase [Armatimonadota bacterium]|nr:dTMP kinase [Armatimonadota bacterium]
MAGKFISIEGPDGAGKSTLARGLHSELTLKGHQVVLTREPGDGPVGPQIRQILLEGVDIDSWTEVFLFLADRRQHVEQFIRPALERGDWVICDRFVDSTIVYQGYGRDLDIGLLRKLNKIATSGLMPDLTLVLDLPVEAALARIGSNDLFDGGAPSRVQNDRLDREPIEFHRRVREGFLAEARLEPDRFRIIDGEGVPSKVLEDAVFALSEHNIPEVRTKL